MMYAYPFTLARRAVVATMDLSARNLHLLRTDHWLSEAGALYKYGCSILRGSARAAM